MWHLLCPAETRRIQCSWQFVGKAKMSLKHLGISSNPICKYTLIFILFLVRNMLSVFGGWTAPSSFSLWEFGSICWIIWHWQQWNIINSANTVKYWWLSIFKCKRKLAADIFTGTNYFKKLCVCFCEREKVFIKPYITIENDACHKCVLFLMNRVSKMCLISIQWFGFCLERKHLLSSFHSSCYTNDQYNVFFHSFVCVIVMMLEPVFGFPFTLFHSVKCTDMCGLISFEEFHHIRIKV